MSLYCPFHGTRLREWSSPLVRMSETTYDRRQRTASHAHLDTTLALVVSGGFAERQGSRTLECGPASVLLRAAGVEHADAFGDRGSACFNLELGARLLDGRPLAGVVSAPGASAGWVATRLLLELRAEPSAEPLSVESQVADLMEALVPAPAAPIPDRVRRILALLGDGFARPWSLTALASEAGVHPMHLARSFRHHCGRSVGQHLRRLRVEHACRSLVSTLHPLAQIAASAGFADQAHLTRVFRRHTGVTPARYRAIFRGGGRFRSFKT